MYFDGVAAILIMKAGKDSGADAGFCQGDSVRGKIGLDLYFLTKNHDHVNFKKCDPHGWEGGVYKNPQILLDLPPRSP